MADKFTQFDIGGKLEIEEKPREPEKADPKASKPEKADFLKEQAPEQGKDKDQPYTGPERRKEHRRKGGDRRSEVRFEPGKDDRRSGRDRRKGVWDGKYTV